MKGFGGFHSRHCLSHKRAVVYYINGLLFCARPCRLFLVSVLLVVGAFVRLGSN